MNSTSGFSTSSSSSTSSVLSEPPCVNYYSDSAETTASSNSPKDYASVSLPRIIDSNQDKVTILAETVEDYVRDIYDEQGRQSAYEALHKFLKTMEATGHLNFDAEEEPLNRNTYINHVLDEMIPSLRINKYQETSEDIWNTPLMKSMPVHRDGDEETLEEFLSKYLFTNEVDTSHQEALIGENLKSYQKILNQIEILESERSNLAYTFAYNVTSWAHSKFKQPNQSNQRNVNLYLNEKYRTLKSLYPEYTRHRTLASKMKFQDNWGKLNHKIGDDLPVVRGSVALLPSTSGYSINLLPKRGLARN